MGRVVQYTTLAELSVLMPPRARALGPPRAFPYTTHYGDFVLQHEPRFARHPRSALRVKNTQRIGADERIAIGQRAAAVRRGEWDAVS